MTNKFLLKNKEDPDKNQYWYSSSTIETVCNFVLLVTELASKTNFNQIVNIVCEHLTSNDTGFENRNVAFLSTPSLFFSVPKKYLNHCTLFDYDDKFENITRNMLLEESNIPHFVLYDFNNSKENIRSNAFHTYSMIIVDPPFITKDVWEKYAQTVKILAANKDCLILCSTIAENESLMYELMSLKPVVYKPNIPNLVYQYNFYANFNSEHINRKNTEIPEFESN